MYVQADDKGVKNNSKTGNGFTVNGEYRVDPTWTVLGRYDSFEADDKKDREEIIAGVAYKYSKNVKFIGNIFHIDKDTNTDDDAKDKYMLTAEVKW
jgi:predicted porin